MTSYVMLNTKYECGNQQSAFSDQAAQYHAAMFVYRLWCPELRTARKVKEPFLVDSIHRDSTDTQYM